MKRIIIIGLLAVASSCGDRENFLCTDNASCNLSGGGACVSAPSGNMWCAYPDPNCESGYRYSDQDVGDGLAGRCTDPGSVPTQHKLTVHLAGSGAGGVTSTPDGLTCASGTCTGTFDEGTIVQLTAIATTGAFLGWSNGCSGQGTCAVMMEQDRSVTALFGIPGQSLWAAHIAGASEERGNATGIDSQGNVIVVGRFAETVTIGNVSLASAGSSDAYVVKFEGESGNVLWAKRFGGGDIDEAHFVAVDASDNIYVSGDFTGSVDFGTGAMTSAGWRDVFVLKLNPAGEAQWTRRFGGGNLDSPGGLDVRDNAVMVGVSFSGSVTVGTSTLVAAGSTDILVVRLDLGGDLSWAHRYGGTDADVSTSIAIDSDANVVLGGRFRGTSNFGGAGLMSAGNFDILLLKLRGTDGAHLMSRRFGSSDFDSVDALAVDEARNILLLGRFRGTVDFGVGDMTSSQATNTDVVLAKYSSAGSCQWAKAFGGTGTLQGRNGTGIAVNAAGDVAIAGYFDGSVNLGGTTLSSAGMNSTDVFAARFSGTDGSHLNSMRAGGTSVELSGGIAQASDGRFFVTGQFTGFADFGGEALTSAGGNDAFLLALAPL